MKNIWVTVDQTPGEMMPENRNCTCQGESASLYRQDIGCTAAGDDMTWTISTTGLSDVVERGKQFPISSSTLVTYWHVGRRWKIRREGEGEEGEGMGKGEMEGRERRRRGKGKGNETHTCRDRHQSNIEPEISD